MGSTRSATLAIGVANVMAAVGLTSCGGPPHTVRPGPLDCVDRLMVDGEEWTAWPTVHRIQRDLVGPPVLAMEDLCTTEGPDGSLIPARDPRVVVLRRMRGIPPDQALFEEDHIPPRNIYVRGTDESLHSVQDLSRKVRRLIMR